MPRCASNSREAVIAAVARVDMLIVASTNRDAVEIGRVLWDKLRDRADPCGWRPAIASRWTQLRG
jgi:hypothetical protein